MKNYWKSEIEILSKEDMQKVKGGDPETGGENPPAMPIKF